MPLLTVEQKRFIVRACACFDSPSEVVRLVKAEFGLDISRQQVQRFNPGTAQGKSLSAPLRELFEHHREQFIEELERQPLAHRAVRLRRLQALYERAEDEKNLKAALQSIALAQREMAALEYATDEEPLV